MLWDPIEKLRTNWNRWRINCTRTPSKDTFCDALLDVRKLMEDNYANYIKIFSSKCKGTPVAKTEDALLRHAYAWTPFTEAERGDGCPPNVNLLQDTPGIPPAPDYNAPCIPNPPGPPRCLYAEYQRVKLAFDKLNYDLFPDRKYVFNPWVKFIHGAKPYADVRNAYAYSVDDALGNVQTDGKGFIVDVGSTKNLENQFPAEPPINISLGFDPNVHPQFSAYRLCENVPEKEKKINPAHAAFIINANNPQNCPVFLIDDKTIMGQPEPRQFYTFRIVTPPPFTLNATQWTPGPNGTAAPIDCTGNGPPFNPPFYQSSRVWCCQKLPMNTGRGVWTKTVPEPNQAHSLLNHFVETIPAMPSTSDPGDTCNRGQ
jgi:hypothetical protein